MRVNAPFRFSSSPILANLFFRISCIWLSKKYAARFNVTIGCPALSGAGKLKAKKLVHAIILELSAH
jgi:hypothetical protein